MTKFQEREKLLVTLLICDKITIYFCGELRPESKSCHFLLLASYVWNYAPQGCVMQYFGIT